MKKFSLALIIVLCLTMFLTACGDKEPSKDGGNTDTNKPVASNEGYFTWDSFETTKITGYTDEGLKQKELTIPEKCTAFGYAALKDNTNVEKVYFESDSISLVGDMFSGCKALVSIDLPNGITEIPNGCFYSCESLQSITIPDSVEEIGRDAFYQFLK